MTTSSQPDGAAAGPEASSPPAYGRPGTAPAPMAIRTPDQRLRGFVSATLDEMAPERAAAKEAITQLRLTPVLFELGARPHPPRSLYRAYLAQSDIFIGIYWQRYGWVAPSMNVSGLEDEYQLSGEKPRLIYIKMPAPEREPRLQALLDRIRDEDVASYRHFSTPDELREVIADDLALVLTEHFASAVEIPAPERPAQLPVSRGLLVDRVQEVASTRALLLRDDVGLVTLTGPGGVGKTRVAVQVASDLTAQFADGVAFIDLASLSDPARLPAAIAQALRIRETRRPQEEDVLSYLRVRQMLLLLDNVEQLIAAAPFATRVLEASPRLKILATSREPLRVRDERIVPMLPLALPEPGTPPAILEELVRIPSVALFVERAREFRPEFTLTNENAAAVAEICRRLDGLPLALELAAARLETLTPRAMLARLGRRLPLLTRGQRDLPARQQTLRNTIAWSYDLLGEGERTLFRRLGVFVGGFTLDAVEEVCLRPDPTLSSPLGGDALDGASSLVDKSLIYPAEEVAEEPRFAMLETIREYATEQMAATGEVAALHHRHATYFLSLAEAAEQHYPRPDRRRWVERLHSEDANLRAALAWSTTNDEDPSVASASSRETGAVPEALVERGELGIRLASALAWYWVSPGRLQEGRGWLETLLARREADDRSATRARAEYGAGVVAWAQGDLSAATDRAEEALAIFQTLEDRQWFAYAQNLLGNVRVSQGDSKAARPLLEASRSVFHETGDRSAEAFTLYYLARGALIDDDFAESQRLGEDSLELFTHLGDSLGQAMALSALGVAAMAQGDSATAVARFAEGLPLMRRGTAGAGFLADFLVEAGTAWMEQGDDEQAQLLFAESLGLLRDFGGPDRVALALAGLGEVAVARGQPQRAARLLGAAKAFRAASGVRDYAYMQALGNRADAAARESLGAEAFETAQAEGAALSVEQVIAEALDETTQGGGATVRTTE